MLETSKSDIIGIDGKQWINIKRKTNTEAVSLLPIVNRDSKSLCLRSKSYKSERLIPCLAIKKSNAYLRNSDAQ
jgi:hypothetical protein